MNISILEKQTVFELPKSNFLYYFGWPTVATMPNGTLVLAASGFRHQHVCPWGKSVIFESTDEGKTWSEPAIVNNSLIDDRDTGLLPLPDGRLIMTWFTSDTRKLYTPDRSYAKSTIDAWTDEAVKSCLGSFIRTRDVDGTWGEVIPIPATSPHGPILLKDGSLLHVGCRFGYFKDGKYDASMTYLKNHGVIVTRSTDDGKTWEELYEFNCTNPDGSGRFCEPHAIELSDGRILAMMRTIPDFTTVQTISSDGGKTWSPIEEIAAGSPPHLIRHSSGALVCPIGYRKAPHGIRALLSNDEGKNWENHTLDDSATHWDLGYPSSVELSDGSIYTVYYQLGALKAIKWSLNS